MRQSFNLFNLYLFLFSMYIISIVAKIPLFSSVFGTIYLSIFLGPLLILLFFKDIANASCLDYFLHSIGLGLFSLMTFATISFFIGLNVDIILLLVNIFIILSLILVRFVVAPEFTFDFDIVLDYSFVVAIIFLLSVIGDYLCLYYFINYIIVFVILLDIILVVVLIDLDSQCYLYIIFAYSLSLLILNSAIGNFFRPTDNIVEYYFSRLILLHGRWLYSLPNDINSMPGAVVLPVIYAEFCNYSLTTFFKWVLPILGSLIPVIMYSAYLKLFENRIAVYSAIFFSSMYVFYTWFGLTAKQVFSGIFLALLISIVFGEYNINTKYVLGLLYSVGIIISHYGTAYIFMICIIGLYITKQILNLDFSGILLSNKFYLVFCIVCALGWYIYFARSLPFVTIISILMTYIPLVFSGKLTPHGSYGSQILFSNLPMYLQVLKCLYAILILLIALGILYKISNLLGIRKKYLDKKVIVFIIISIFMLILSIFSITGNLSSTMTPDRMLQISAFFLSPFFVIGCVLLGRFIGFRGNTYTILVIFLVVFILFNTCLAAEVIWGYNVGPSICVSYPRVISHGTVLEKEYLSRVYLFLGDFYGSNWLCKFYTYHPTILCSVNSEKYFTYCGFTSVDSNVGSRNVAVITPEIAYGSYIFLNYFNIMCSKVKVTGGLHPKLVSISTFKLFKFSRIYSNTYCDVYVYK